MSVGQMGSLIQFLRRLVVPAPAAELSDAHLLERFSTERDEMAFRALLQRHGPMVLGVCRRVLGDSHAVEDAFQATFLVLVRKAGSLHRRELLANWLYGVAYRTALKARTSAARRRAHERASPLMTTTADPTREVMWRDLRPVFDEELDRLPPKYRQPVVLCYLEGKTNEEAARELGCPCGTIFTRLSRARNILRGRLVRRGLTVSGPALAFALTQEAPAAVPAALTEFTVSAAAAFAAGNAAAGVAVSAPVAALAEGVLRAMFLTKLKNLAVLAIIFSVLGTGGVTFAYRNLAADDSASADRSVSAPRAQDAETPPAALAQQQPRSGSAPRGSGAGGAGAGIVGGGGGSFAGGFGFPGAGFAGWPGSCTGGGAFAGGFGGGGGGGFGGGFGGFGGASPGFGSCKLDPLTQKPVQQELKLTREQLQKLEVLKTKQQQAILRLANLKPDAQRAKLGELVKTAEKDVTRILTAAQHQRLQEISLQLRGGQALHDPEIADALKLTEAQREQIKAVQAEAVQEMQRMFPSPGSFTNLQEMQKTFEKMSTKLEELVKSTDEKLLDVLTTEQKMKWKELTGEPFKRESPGTGSQK